MIWKVDSNYALSQVPNNWNFQSQYAFILANLINNPENTEIFTGIEPEQPKPWYNKFILKFSPFYIIKGEFIEKDLIEILPISEKFIVTYEKSNHSIIKTLIPKREITDKSGIGTENHFRCMTITKDEIQFPHKKIDAESFFIKDKTDLDNLGWGNINLNLPFGAGMVLIGKKGEKLPRTIAPAPNLVLKKGFSFAIIRGVETKEKFRNKGYAQAAVADLAKSLFKEDIESIHLWVEYNNKIALRVYQNLGFKETGNWFSCLCNPH